MSTEPAESSSLQPDTQPTQDTEANTNFTANPTQHSSSHDPSLDNIIPDADTNDADLDAEIIPPDAADAMNLDASASDTLPPVSQLANAAANNSLDAQAQAAADAAHHPSVLEARIPAKKDASLRQFLSKMDDYAPLIPDAVTDYYLTLSGLPPPPQTDRRLARLLALATQKFIADVAADAYQYSRIRSTNTTSNNPLTGLGGAAGMGMQTEGGGAGENKAGGAAGKKDAGKAAPLGGPRAGYGGGGAGQGQGRTVLTMEDLGMAVGEYGVNVKRGEFYR